MLDQCRLTGATISTLPAKGWKRSRIASASAAGVLFHRAASCRSSH
jgi:hypothetical protein